MRVFLLKTFRRYQRSEGIPDKALINAVQRAESGLIDAALGGELIKQRVPRSGQGRSGGFRTIIAWRQGDCAVFLLGFAKSDTDNIEPDELATLKKIGAEVLGKDDKLIAKAIKDTTLWEIDYENEKKQ